MRPANSLFAFALIAVVAAFPAYAQDSQPEASLVGVDKVVRQPLSQTTSVIGRLVPRQRGTVAAATNGPVGEVAVAVGDRVSKGDLLVQIRDTRIRETRNLYAAQVGEAQAKVETAEAELAQAELELKRSDQLKKSAAFSQAKYEDQLKQVATSQSLVAEAENAVYTAQSELRRAEIDVFLARITAPFDGVVVEKHTEVGAYLGVGDPVVSLINDIDLEIEADVPTGLIAGLTPGRAVQATVFGGLTFDAFVRAVIPEENALTRTRAVRFDAVFPKDETVGPLASGQTITVHVPIGEDRQVVTVHKDAILTQGTNKSVYVVENGIAQPRPVDVGRAVGNRLEVIGGLKPDDVVVIRGNERLQPGQPVTYPGASGDSAATDANG
ncbi:MAG: efflux RND transporter periplasmic adaptor subunit [Alphaproteobacteria bacterium]